MLKPASGVRWSVETDGVLIVKAREARLLAYPEAAVWDLAMRWQDLPAITRKLAWIAGTPPEQSVEFARELLRAWRRQGLVEEVEGDG